MEKLLLYCIASNYGYQSEFIYLVMDSGNCNSEIEFASIFM